VSDTFQPAPDQRCCGTCRNLTEHDVDDGWGVALQCESEALFVKRETKHIGARWWGGACPQWQPKERAA
jgi:hypothetical protein